MCFFIVVSCCITAWTCEVLTLKSSDYFGENALLRDEPRAPPPVTISVVSAASWDGAARIQSWADDAEEEKDEEEEERTPVCVGQQARAKDAREEALCDLRTSDAITVLEAHTFHRHRCDPNSLENITKLVVVCANG